MTALRKQSVTLTPAQERLLRAYWQTGTHNSDGNRHTVDILIENGLLGVAPSLRVGIPHRIFVTRKGAAWCEEHTKKEGGC
jgi:hypothetical protein